MGSANAQGLGAGSGGSGVLAYFSLVKDITYTITLRSGSQGNSRNGTTSAGYSDISNSSLSFLIRGYGGTTTLTTDASCVGIPTSNYTLYSGGLKNSGAGFSLSLSSSIPSGGKIVAPSEIITLITSKNSNTNGFSGGGSLPRTANQNGLGGVYNAGGNTGSSIITQNGTGYGTGSGQGVSKLDYYAVGTPGKGVVFLYLSPLI
jgi:hypothetical protein